MDAFVTAARNSRTLLALSPAQLGPLKKKIGKSLAAFVEDQGFSAKAGTMLSLPGEKGIDVVLFGIGDDKENHANPFFWASAGRVPQATYSLHLDNDDEDVFFAAALGWALSTYRFSRYKKNNAKTSKLVWPNGVDKKEIQRLFEAISLGRDLVTTPANNMGPAELEFETKKLAKQHQAKVTTITGKDLLKKNYPAIYEVGKGSARAPRLLDLKWGNAKHKKLTLVGKGVCFDTGGYSMKSGAGMLLMKKDMGGAAMVLALAHLVMDAKLPVRLRVLIPAVENSVSDRAMRPSDVIDSRKGLTIEVGNTDAEGRLVLCDALCEASREKPDLLLDFATLTGAARVALGTDMPALFTNSDEWAEQILEQSDVVKDPIWRMPLFAPYKRKLRSEIADTNNIASGSYGGAITAALFLELFVDDGTPWAHVDLMAYNLENRPGRPKGGEVMAVRAAFAALRKRYAKPTSSTSKSITAKKAAPAKKTPKKATAKSATAKKSKKATAKSNRNRK
ncbi:MAG: leucyl aminopeptidase family protein [Deltaproteobacteria bacterium]|nr:leucyl aminopeptidase family protein [Deltaproteobacteria bacterium]